MGDVYYSVMKEDYFKSSERYRSRHGTQRLGVGEEPLRQFAEAPSGGVPRDKENVPPVQLLLHSSSGLRSPPM